ncbi:MAG: flagellar motor switch phosphatase FliY [Oscillospiraceae bacterium]|nr:flagellar motor switch phosphatase FliY [Oscillospiraceae bacterium]
MGEAILNETKTDAIGEIHNITMGSAADAISSMIDARVSITTPQVSVCKASDVARGKLNESVSGDLFEEGVDAVYVKIDYVKGIKGTSLLVLNPDDVQIIVNKLMGMPPEVTDDFEFDEMRISAICEVMNQMMGASATSMSQMLNTPIDISPPETIVSDDNNLLLELQNVNPNDNVCAVSFDLMIDDIIKSKFINLLSIDLADSMVEKLFQINMGTDSMGTVLDDMDDDLDEVLNDEKRDAIGELQNMMMGSAATALSNFMNAKVWITTPKVSVAKAGNIKFDDLDPSICVKIQYVKGMHGSSILVLKQSDVQLMVNQLMGLPPVVTDDFVFDEMNISAVCEIMNQMMGASATTLSEILNTPTDISTPEAIVIDTVEDILKINNIAEDQTVCAISFDLTIDDIISSHFVTMLTIDLANEMGDKMLGSYSSNDVPAPPPEPKEKPAPAPAPKPAEKKRKPAARKPKPAESKVINNNSSAAKSMKVEEFNMGSFYDDDDDDNIISREQFKNLRPLLDVPMEVSVRIGTTQRRIEEVSDFTKGTIIELDTMANEPVEIMVNGNLMARGEVVVVDDNFAVRITEIVK